MNAKFIEKLVADRSLNIQINEAKLKVQQSERQIEVFEGPWQKRTKEAKLGNF